MTPEIVKKIAGRLDRLDAKQRELDVRAAEAGPVGPMPDHKWIGTKLQFEKPDGDWGAAVDLKGDKGDPGKGGSGGVIVRDSDGGGGIDDATVGTDTTWSSEKIAAELATVAPPEEGGVASVNGRGGAVVLTASDVGLPNVADLAPEDLPVSDAAQVALNDLQAQIDDIPDAPVHSVAGRTGDVTLSAADVGLPNVVNLAPADLPISDATQAALDAKTTPAYVDAKVAALVNSSPSALDTLKELADALGDDPNFATTMTTALGGKEASITAGTTAQYWRGDKTWRDIFTDVRAATLTGLSTATNAVIAATDTVLGALGKLQAQITAMIPWLASTGDFKFVMRANAPTGWIVGDGSTIGSASSGATRANADTQALFTAWWTDYTNAQLPILTSAGGASTRGASAAADWAANKRLTVFDMRDRFVRGASATNGNGTAQADALQGHWHIVSAENLSAGSSDFNATSPLVTAGAAGISTRGSPVGTTSFTANTLITNNVNGTPRVASETRPMNIPMLGCFKL